MQGVLVRSFGSSLARKLTKSVQFVSKKNQNQQFFIQYAPPGKVKVTSSAASELKSSHRLLQ